MKKLILFLCLFSVSFGYKLSAQVGVGPIERVKTKAGEFTEEDLSRLKASKTIFVYRPSDDLETLEKAIKEVWTITPIEMRSYKQFVDQPVSPTTSVFSIGGLNTEVQRSSGSGYDNTHIYLKLWMPDGKKKQHHYARIELHPRYVDYAAVTGEHRGNAVSYLYKKAKLKNWQTGMLRNYLKQVNDLLTAGEEQWIYESRNDARAVKQLKQETLYVVDYAMVKFGMTTGDESKQHKEKSLFKSYPYKYELISADELSQKILSETETFKYAIYVKSSTDKYLSIYDSQTGETVYTHYKPVSYNLKDADFKKVVAAIDGKK